jgi:hypothetical protein
MNAALAKAVRKQFGDELQRILPKFHLDREGQLPPGWLAFKCVISPALAFYIILVISDKDDRFTVELAWSTTGKLPTHTSFGPKAPAASTGIEFRLSNLWLGEGGDFWWRIGTEHPFPLLDVSTVEADLKARRLEVPAQVDAAIAPVLRFGVPYFESIAQQFGFCIKFGCLRAKWDFAHTLHLNGHWMG